MHSDEQSTNTTPLADQRAYTTVFIRLTIGLLQGLVLYLLYRAGNSDAWPATNAVIFPSLLLAFSLVPVLAISGLSHLTLKSLLKWIVVATIICLGLGYYDGWRNIGVPSLFFSRGSSTTFYPSPFVVWFGIAGFFIAHALVLAAAHDHKKIASYSSYFETAWTLLIQIAFSLVFVGVLWLVLWLGVNLFKLINLLFLDRLVQQSWFVIPVTAFAFACAVHLTDVRPAIVRGIRYLLLVLLSWLLPIALLLIGGFLCSLPFTGLTLLWSTKHATAILLSACAALIIFINAAFQNGQIANEVPSFLRVCARAACLLLIPTVAIAVYALSLRVGDHGWTTDRIIAACCLFVATSYALGYSFAACQTKSWLSNIAPVNIFAAFSILVIVLALFFPILDPARVSVASQLAALESGKISADKFDYRYLRFQGKRFGNDALRQLEVSNTSKDSNLIRERAKETLALTDRYSTNQIVLTSDEIIANITVWPKQNQLPISFTTTQWGHSRSNWQVPDCLWQRHAKCDAFLIDFNGEGKNQVLVIESAASSGYRSRAIVFEQAADTKWEPTARFPDLIGKCPNFIDELKAGNYSLEPSKKKDLKVSGVTFAADSVTDRQIDCSQALKGGAASK